MYSYLRTWFNTNMIDVINSTQADTNDMQELDVTLSFESAPANLCDKGYFLKIESIDETETENKVHFEVNLICEMSFLMVNKDQAEYNTIISDYVYKMARLLKKYSGSNTSGSYYFNEVVMPSIKVEGLNNFDKQYLKPAVKFSVRVTDRN